MNLAVVTHKRCWPSASSPIGYATDGGFAFQIRALSELFDATVLVVPCRPQEELSIEVPLDGHKLSLTRLGILGSGMWRRLHFPVWLLVNFPTIFREVRQA